jgi:hypothetical protein
MNEDSLQSKRIYADETYRYLSARLYEIRLLHEKNTPMEHIVYSTSTGSVFFAPCHLFGVIYLAVIHWQMAQLYLFIKSGRIT